MFTVGREADGAGNEIRTRDTKLGKLVLYQLSYARSNGRKYHFAEVCQATPVRPAKKGDAFKAEFAVLGGVEARFL